MQSWELDNFYQSTFGKIAYEVFGQGAPIVMIHGTPFSSFVWRYFVRELARSYQVFVFDLLGYGASEQRVEQDVSLATQPKILRELLDFWQLHQPIAIAHDFGGTTTLRAHLLESCEFTRIILIDPVAISPWGSPFIQHVRKHFQAFAEVPPNIHGGILDAYIQDAAFRPLLFETLSALKQPWMGKDGQPAFYRQIAQMDQKYTDEIQERYSEIHCPVNLIWGEEDTWIPLQIGRRVHEAIPGSSFATITAAAHLVQEDQPDRLLELLLNILNG